MGLQDVAVCPLGVCHQPDKFGDSGRSNHSDLMFSICHLTKDLGFRSHTRIYHPVILGSDWSSSSRDMI